MRNYLAVVEKTSDSAYGAWFPDLPTVFTASDEESDLITNAIEALRLYGEDAALPDPSTIETVLAREDVRRDLAEGAFLVRVPLIDTDTRVVRANLTFEAGMLRAIDEAAARRGLTRSAFLAGAARKEIETAS